LENGGDIRNPHIEISKGTEKLKQKNIGVYQKRRKGPKIAVGDQEEGFGTLGLKKE